jgi:YggT family protein
MTLAQILVAGQLAAAIHFIFRLLQLLVFARVIISWIPSINRYHPVARFIYQTTEPMLRPFRAVLPVGGGGIDFSPVILLVVLVVAERLILALLGA